VEGKYFPELRTYGDVVRDALVHRVRYYIDRMKAEGKPTGRLESAWAADVRSAEIDAIREKHNAWRKLIEDLDSTLHTLIEQGDYDTAWYLIETNQDADYMSEPMQKRMAQVIAKHTASLESMAAGCRSSRTSPTRRGSTSPSHNQRPMTTTRGLVLPKGTARPAYDHPLPTWVEALREHQVEAVREIIEHFRSGVDVVFLDAPVGAGKTLIGELVRRELGIDHAIYICSDRQLQDQFARDFEYARVLKGRANYPTMLGGRAVTADDCTSEGADDTCMWCDPKHECPYQVAKAQAAAAPVAVLNTSYFLHVTNYTRAFTPNDLVIADEADLLEDALLGFSEYEVPTWIGKRLQLEYPKKGVRKPTLVKWLNDVADRASAWLREHAQGLNPRTAASSTRSWPRRRWLRSSWSATFSPLPSTRTTTPTSPTPDAGFASTTPAR
jgi:Rad3-related DNA helicases